MADPETREIVGPNGKPKIVNASEVEKYLHKYGCKRKPLPKAPKKKAAAKPTAEASEAPAATE